MPNANRPKGKERGILTFEPKLASQIISREVGTRARRKQKAGLRKLIEEAVILQFGHKYPKLCSPESIELARRGLLP